MGAAQTPGENPVIILGAGCAGLAAGLRLAKRGIPVLLLEQDDHVGGLAGGVPLNGNVYEYGPHTFHTTDPEILADIKSLMGDELIDYKRTIQINFMGKYFTFPLTMTDVLLKLPPATVVRAGLSFGWYFITGAIRKPKVETSETVLKRFYGDVLYEIFFKNYIINVWGISPAEFSPAFARQRIPRMNLLGSLEKLISRAQKQIRRNVKTDDYVEKVEGNLYTTKKGFSLITQRMANGITDLGGRVLLNAEVTRIMRAGDCVQSVEYRQNGERRELACRAVINTLPINEAIRMIEPALNPEVVRSAEALRFRALVFVGLLIRRPQVLPSSFMYFRQHSFNRVSDLAQFGFHIQPEGCTQLVAEISCGVDDPAWKDDRLAVECVTKDLVSEGLIREDEVLETHVFRAEHAYPIYTLHYEEHLKTLLEAIDRMANLDTAGRQGRFQYINTHIAIKMGYEAADRLANRLQAEQNRV